METKKMNQDYENEFLSDLQELEYKTMLEKASSQAQLQLAQFPFLLLMLPCLLHSRSL